VLPEEHRARLSKRPLVYSPDECSVQSAVRLVESCLTVRITWLSFAQLPCNVSIVSSSVSVVCLYRFCTGPRLEQNKCKTNRTRPYIVSVEAKYLSLYYSEMIDCWPLNNPLGSA
jgi:hypothetical protein